MFFIFINQFCLTRTADDACMVKKNCVKNLCKAIINEHMYKQQVQAASPCCISVYTVHVPLDRHWSRFKQIRYAYTQFEFACRWE